MMPFAVKILASLLLLAFACAPLYARTLRDNLADARKALKAKKWGDAKLSSKAALTMDSGNQEAHLILSDVFAGEGKQTESLLSAIDAYDSPKRGERSASSRTKKARKRIKALSPTLDEFLSLRAETAAGVVKIQKSAKKAKREPDAEWVEMIACRVAPTEQVVVDASSGRSEEFWRRRNFGGAEARLLPGYVSLLKEPKVWIFYDQAPKSEATDSKITLFVTPQRYIVVAISKNKTGVGFTLKYSVKWERDKNLPAGRSQRLYLFFHAGRGPSPSDTTLCITADKKKSNVSFSYVVPGRGFVAETESAIKYDLVRHGKWIDVEVNWSGPGGLLKMKIGGKAVLSTTPTGREPRNVNIGFGVANMKKGTFKNPRIRVRQAK